MVKNKDFEMHLISQTHWDREWRFSSQEIRAMLVDTMDSLLKIMEQDPDYSYYHLDGQTRLLEEYLEIRPENRKRLEKYIREGRILIGPWYILPEENLITGECLVRNLLLGHKIAEEFGQVMKTGYTPSSFGQVSQMPQILKGFGIDTIIFYHGAPPLVQSEFIWKGPDGEQILAISSPRGGKWCNFTSSVMYPAFWNDDGLGSGKIPSLIRQQSYRLGREESPRAVYYCLTRPHDFSKDELALSLKQFVEDIKKEAKTKYLLCWEGIDIGHIHKILPKMIAESNRSLSGTKIIISSLPKYVNKLKPVLGNLATIKGEMRYPQKDEYASKLYPGIVSARMYLKQINRKIENKIINGAELFSTMAWILGKEYPRALLEKSWKILLTNQFHDSLGGTGVDQIHEDMLSRYKQAELITDDIIRRKLSEISGMIDTSASNDALITVFNSLPYTRNEVITTSLDIPREKGENFSLVTPGGEPVLCQIVSKEKTVTTIQGLYYRIPFPLPVTRIKLHLMADKIPAWGYRCYLIKAGQQSITETTALASDDRVMENSFLRVMINDNGTIKIFDKSSGVSYDNLHYFEDSGETGDPYEHHTPGRDNIVTTLKEKANIKLAVNGPLAATYKITISLTLPESVTPDLMKRSPRKRKCVIESLVTLKKNARRVDIVTQVDNQIKDHRLRVMFPTNIPARFTWAEVPFDVIRRSIRIPDAAGWLEPPSSTQPHLNFIDVSDGKKGLAVINEGLPEYEVLNDKKRTVALTLLRCFAFVVRKTGVRDAQQNGSQCPGIHRFKYALYPHQGHWQKGRVWEQAYQCNLPVETVQSWGHRGGYLPLSMSFFEVSPSGLIVSALKKIERRESVLLRVFNPTTRSLSGKIVCFRKIKKAWLLDLNENRKDILQIKRNGVIALSVKKKEIISLEISLV